MKDRTHYGLMDSEVVMEVTPEQAAEWINTRPPPPAMWTRGAANREKAQGLADAMAAGEWEVDRPVEPVSISLDHNYVLGGHHRLTAVTLLGRPQELRVRFYTRPQGWESYGAQRMRIERETGRTWDGNTQAARTP